MRVSLFNETTNELHHFVCLFVLHSQTLPNTKHHTTQFTKSNTKMFDFIFTSRKMVNSVHFLLASQFRCAISVHVLKLKTKNGTDRKRDCESSCVCVLKNEQIDSSSIITIEWVKNCCYCFFIPANNDHEYTLIPLHAAFVSFFFLFLGYFYLMIEATEISIYFNS